MTIALTIFIYLAMTYLCMTLLREYHQCRSLPGNILVGIFSAPFLALYVYLVGLIFWPSDTDGGLFSALIWLAVIMLLAFPLAVLSSLSTAKIAKNIIQRR